MPETEDSSVPAGTGSGLPCMPCRGTGRVISMLGGNSTLMTCPWCGGGRVRLEGIDAQAQAPAAAASAPGSGDAPAERSAGNGAAPG